MAIKVLICDDHAIVRRGLKEIIDEQPDMKVGGETAHGQEVLDRVRAEPWDIVILDISMPGRNGLEILKDLKREFPKLPVLILSVHSEDQYAVRTLIAGAAGYLTKESAPQELVGAVRKAMEGGKYVSHSLAEKLAEVLHIPLRDQPHEALSDREYEVMRLIARGKGMTQIAESLGLSVKTVSTYRTRILEKMHLESNADLVRYAIENKILV